MQKENKYSGEICNLLDLAFEDANPIEIMDIDLIKNIKNDIERHSKKLQKDLKDYISKKREERADKGYCPYCDTKLEAVSAGSESAEVWGKTETWDDTLMECPICGWR